MAHPRKLIRQAVVALLGNATDAGDRVQGTRVEPNEARELPALSVYTLNEPVDEDSADTAPRELTRKLQLEVAGWVAHKDSYPADDAMDDLAEQIEARMDSDRWLGGPGTGLLADSILTGTVMEVVDVDGRSDPTCGIVVLTYTMTYRTDPLPASAYPNDDFRRVDTKTTPVGSTVDTPIVEDTFTVQETPAP